MNCPRGPKNWPFSISEGSAVKHCHTVGVIG